MRILLLMLASSVMAAGVATRPRLRIIRGVSIWAPQAAGIAVLSAGNSAWKARAATAATAGKIRNTRRRSATMTFRALRRHELASTRNRLAGARSAWQGAAVHPGSHPVPRSPNTFRTKRLAFCAGLRGAAAHARRGAADRGQHRQATGAAADGALIEELLA